MNAFPLLAAFTLCVSFAVLRATFDDLREAPMTLDLGTVAMREIAAHKLVPAGTAWTPSTLHPSTSYGADEGLLDRDLASDDPIQAWLDRYLTPPTE
jgi:hypothetical protein